MATISGSTGNVVNAVFQTPELVMSVFDYLDELSLVRVQGVNRFTCDVVQNTKMFRRRLCLPVQGDEVIENSAHSSDDIAKANIRFNPLLDWLTAQSFMISSPFGGLISQSNNTSAFLHVLPHALRGLRKADTPFCGMYITSPPVTTIILRGSISERNIYGKPYTVKSPTGVTIAEVLTHWFSPDKGVKFWNQPTYLQLPGSPPQAYKSGEDSLSGVFGHQSYHFQGTKLYGRKPQHTKYGVTHELLMEWYACTAGKKWWMSSMKEQREFMIKMLEKMKAIAKMQVLPEDEQYPAWPALAWKDEGKTQQDGGDAAPYKVEYACGLVFNRHN